MIKFLKKILIGSPNRGEPLKPPRIHHITMPVPIPFEEWERGEWIKNLT